MNRSFQRKVLYLLGMVALLYPLFALSRPDAGGNGKLAELRAEHGLSQANLGEIDPTGETIKLATLGMRGVAANILWQKANDYQKKEDWTNLSATLEQISRLQPHFISVWRFQGWNLSYNVSAEWDDYRQRYNWVLKGVHFLDQGRQYNKNEPILPWDQGWFIGHKMGTADEKKQYRLLFRLDDDFHGSRPMHERDNWLVGKERFRDAQKIVDSGASPVRGQTPVLFHSHPVKWQTNYAAALQLDGGLEQVDGQWQSRAVFGERARVAWDQAAREWDEFGSTRDLPSSIGKPIRLNDLETHRSEARRLAKQLDALQPGLREQIVAEKRAKLAPALLAALEVPPDDRDADEAHKAGEAEQKIRVTHEEVAKRVSEAHRAKAEKLAKQAREHEELARSITSSREIIQYEYWTTRCKAERTADARTARELMYKAHQAYLDTDLVTARELYEESFRKWRVVLDQYPSLIADRVIGDDLVGPKYLPGAIRIYVSVLKGLGEKFPDDFILQDVIDAAQPDTPIDQ